MLALNPAVSGVRCSNSGELQTRGDRPLALCRCCPAPGAPLCMEYTPGAWRNEAVRGLFRYEPLLPITGASAAYAEDVGGTPIERCSLGGELEVELWIKPEGGNPSGSFKDRGLAIGVALAVAQGALRLCLPTQGSAGVSAALFCARLGLPAPLLYMPEGHRGGRYHRAAEHFGADVHFAGAQIAEAGRAMRSEHAGGLSDGTLVDLSTFREPGRLEGKKTMGLEIVEAFAGALLMGSGAPEPHAERLPDFVVYPTGGGTGLVGIWKAFGELRARGVLTGELRTHMVAVQSERCAPVVRSFEAGARNVAPVRSEGTIADGLDVPEAIMGHGMLATLYDSGGCAVAVSDAAILEEFARFGRAGVSASYEAAATLAGTRELRRRGTIPAGARVLLVLTAGHTTSLK